MDKRQRVSQRKLPKYWKRQLSLLVIFSLLMAPIVGANNDGNKELKILKGKITNLSTQLNQDKQTRKELIDSLASTEKKIGAIGHSIHLLEKDILRQDQQLNDLANKNAIQRSSLNKQRNQLSGQVVSAYAMGRQERLKMMLNQQDPALMNRVMTYYDYFNRERVRQIDLTKQMIKEISDTELVIGATKKLLQQNHTEKKNQLNEMHLAKLARSDLVKKLNLDIKTNSQSLTQLKEDAKALTNLLADIVKQQRIQKQIKQKKLTQLKGRLPWPTSGYLSVFYGAPKAGGVNWDGVFIKATEGDEVKAIHSGRVAYADWLRGYGLLLIIDHGEGIMTLYGHNQSLFKEVGDNVIAEEPIAMIGNSGGQKSAGLYFSVRKNGKPSNPKNWCKKPKGRIL